MALSGVAVHGSSGARKRIGDVGGFGAAARLVEMALAVQFAITHPSPRALQGRHVSNAAMRHRRGSLALHPQAGHTNVERVAQRELSAIASVTGTVARSRDRQARASMLDTRRPAASPP